MKGAPKITRPSDPAFAARIGTTVWIKCGWHGIFMPVRIVDTRVKWGWPCYDIEPVVGLGLACIKSEHALTEADVREMLGLKGNCAAVIHEP
jgi:hypothetical protein